MTPVSLAQLKAATGGNLIGEDCLLNSFSTDTRTVASGDVYFCLRGDNFDGHEFVQQAIDAGALAVVCEKNLPLDVAQLVVADTRRALGLFAQLWRQQFSKPLIGITGSNGKTTVKQLLVSIFSQAGDVHGTRANDNNEIGVPQTLLGLNDQNDFAVVEMGASDKGEIQWLGQLARPTISVITNASAAHLEGFGNARSVAEEKAWIYKSLAATGTAIINADDQFADYWKSLCGDRKIITFGVSGDVTAKREDNGSISIVYAGSAVQCDFPLAGHHNVQNAAAAAACAIAAGVSLEVIATGLAVVQPVAGRLDFQSLATGITVIDDTYNANPASTRAAIDVLHEWCGTRVIALGDLLELGADEVQEHRAIGEYAKANQVDRLFAYGELTQHTVKAFGSGGQWFSSQQELIEALEDVICDGYAVLVKGSRSMRMERVAAAIVERFSEPQSGACCQ